jgi:Malonate decarboxylase, alpha subunit, transporter
MESIQSWMDGPLLKPEHTLDALHSLIQPFDRVELEGDNQKQADFLSRSLDRSRQLTSAQSFSSRNGTQSGSRASIPSGNSLRVIQPSE